MRIRTRTPAVSPELVDRIDSALAVVAERRAELDRVRSEQASRHARRAAHAALRAAYLEADRLLREATHRAKQHSRREWLAWRQRLAPVSTARQVHLMEEADDDGVRPVGSVRALDTGMSGPAIGDLLHGRAGMPRTVPTYGLDVETVLDRQAPVTARAEVIDLAPVRRPEAAADPHVGARHEPGQHPADRAGVA